MARQEITAEEFWKIRNLMDQQIEMIKTNPEYADGDLLIKDIWYESAPSGDVLFVTVQYVSNRKVDYTVILE